ncbi:aldo/keto reductase [Paenibacillus sp. chi10]|uniref:Aldo/keto reductase n=1 Tax=Paenibacillus suaedae TaxID=3077233 RepID=A0AAJ2K377_9BACL|nr:MULTISPECIES: aldo/keto reductase [unclassified Paenibacillus]MDT8979745.1 aldo/keto reductase [Paenibacillus sp. chi10]
MMHTLLGTTQIQVSKLGLGCAPLSVAGRPDRGQAIATIQAAFESGITLFDTADTYCLDDHDLGHNEQLLQEALSAYSTEEYLIITKGGLARPNGSWICDGRPDSLRSACELSLHTLKRECHPLYILHAPDPSVPIEESVGALSRLQEEGKILHIGLSNVTVSECQRVQQIAPITCIQNRLHLHDRHSNDVLRYCDEHRISFIAYSPFGGPSNSIHLQNHPVLSELAQKYSASPYQIVIAWLLALSPNLIPIPAATKPSSIQDSVRGMDILLDEADLLRLTNIDQANTPT